MGWRHRRSRDGDTLDLDFETVCGLWKYHRRVFRRQKAADETRVRPVGKLCLPLPQQHATFGDGGLRSGVSRTRWLCAPHEDTRERRVDDQQRIDDDHPGFVRSKELPGLTVRTAGEE